MVGPKPRCLTKTTRNAGRYSRTDILTERAMLQGGVYGIAMCIQLTLTLKVTRQGQIDPRQAQGWKAV